jgi:hypothetical protein
MPMVTAVTMANRGERTLLAIDSVAYLKTMK